MIIVEVDALLSEIPRDLSHPEILVQRGEAAVSMILERLSQV